jgi:D-xylose transport system substrate-binding protein
MLRKKRLTGKVRVTGLGATSEALRAILRGDQFMTAFRPVEQQATAAARLAGALVRNDHATAAAMASIIVTEPAGHRTVHAVLVPPVFITLDTIKQVIDSGVVRSRDICVSELALRCGQLDIPR